MVVNMTGEQRRTDDGLFYDFDLFANHGAPASEAEQVCADPNEVAFFTCEIVARLRLPRHLESPGLLALGFLGPEEGPIKDLGLKTDERSNIAADTNCMNSVPGVFACGDARCGQSLVVWAIWEGCECARGVDQYLMGRTDLPASPQVVGADRGRMNRRVGAVQERPPSAAARKPRRTSGSRVPRFGGHDMVLRAERNADERRLQPAQEGERTRCRASPCSIRQPSLVERGDGDQELHRAAVAPYHGSAAAFRPGAKGEIISGRNPSDAAESSRAYKEDFPYLRASVICSQLLH